MSYLNSQTNSAAAAPTSGGGGGGDYPIERAGLSEHQVQQLRTYMEYMLEVNKSMNLTGA